MNNTMDKILKSNQMLHENERLFKTMKGVKNVGRC